MIKVFCAPTYYPFTGRIGANRSIEFMTILGGAIGVANGALLAGWVYFGGVSMAALYIPGMFVSLAQGLSMPLGSLKRFSCLSPV